MVDSLRPNIPRLKLEILFTFAYHCREVLNCNTESLGWLPGDFLLGWRNVDVRVLSVDVPINSLLKEPDR